jgi:dihydroorotate dehydrogenase (NAD+) catalytic subunit
LSTRAHLETRIAGLTLRNPLMLASGFLDETASSMKRVWDAGAGAIVTKSIGSKPRRGHPNPSLVEVHSGYLNAMGLPNPGIDEFVHEIEATIAHGATVIASVFGSTEEEFSMLTSRASEAGAHAVELNVSCPHAKGYGTDIGCDVRLLGPVVAAARKGTKKPLFVKLSPNVPDIRVQAQCAVDNGADGLVCVNTLKALAIDAETRRPILGNKVGGLSGPALKPVALRAVYDVASLGLKVPIIGVGGIETGRDVVEFLLAGASAVQIGSVLVRDDIAAFARIRSELETWMKEHDVARIEDLTGAMPTDAR